jgi:hypothetical protein
MPVESGNTTGRLQWRNAAGDLSGAEVDVTTHLARLIQVERIAAAGK